MAPLSNDQLADWRVTLAVPHLTHPPGHQLPALPIPCTEAPERCTSSVAEGHLRDHRWLFEEGPSGGAGKVTRRPAPKPDHH